MLRTFFLKRPIVNSGLIILAILGVIALTYYIENNKKIERTNEFIHLSKDYLFQGESLRLRDLLNTIDTKKFTPEITTFMVQINNYLSYSFLEATLKEMKSSDYELLKQGKLATRFLEDPDLNKLFIEKLQRNTQIKEEIIICEQKEHLRLEREQASQNLVKNIIAKYAKPFTVLQTSGPIDSIDIYAPTAVTTKERGATVLAAYEQHKYNQIAQVNLAPCDSSECLKAYQTITGGSIATVSNFENVLNVTASDVKIKAIDIQLMMLTATLMLNDPLWYNYVEQGTEYQLIFDIASQRFHYIAPYLTLNDVQYNRLINQDGFQDCLKIDNNEVTYNIYAGL